VVYKNQFVSAIKVNGKVLREDQGSVTIPFGSEYTVLLKNLNSVRAMAKVSVDGQDATEGTWLVIPANSNIELERFIRNGNLQAGNRFKFIERTKEIEDHRGIGSDDGLVRIEYKFERKVEEVPITRYRYYDKWIPVERPYNPRPWWFGDVWCGSTTVGRATRSLGGIQETATGSQNAQAMNCSFSATMDSCPELERSVSNDQGITVAGSESHQSFTSTSWFDTEASNVLVIKLRGSVAGQQVVEPVTVQHKPKCFTCGKYNKATSKFCDQCGTALILI
jgi:hypothetical protein